KWAPSETKILLSVNVGNSLQADDFSLLEGNPTPVGPLVGKRRAAAELALHSHLGGFIRDESPTFRLLSKCINREGHGVEYMARIDERIIPGVNPPLGTIGSLAIGFRLGG